MKKLFVPILLLLSMVISGLSACVTPTTTPPDATAEITSGDETSAETDDVTTGENVEPEPPKTVIFEAGASSFSIVRPNLSSKYLMALINQFAERMTASYGAVLPIVSDSSSSLNKNDPTLNELLIGKTNREFSYDALDKLDSASGNRFVIKASQYKLAIIASTDYLTFEAMDYLFNNYVTSDDNGVPMLAVPSDLEYVSDDREVSEFPYKDYLKASKKIAFYSDSAIVAVPPTDSAKTVQGIGTDGKYIYANTVKKVNGVEIAYMRKFDMETNKSVAVSGPLDLGHANDITYDPVKKLLMVCYCSGTYRNVVYVDPETLTIVDTIDTKIVSRALDYVPTINGFVFADAYTNPKGIPDFTIVVTDYDFNPIRSFKCQNPKYTTQGLCTDGEFIFDVRWEKNAMNQSIVIHDLNGEYKQTAFYIDMSSEPESIFPYKGGFAIGLNNANRQIMYVKPAPEKWWAD